MKKQVGVKELKNKATQILRQVREKKVELVITSDGEPIAILSPFSERDQKSLRKQRRLAVFKEVEEGFEQLNKSWPEDLGAAEAVSKQRR